MTTPCIAYLETGAVCGAGATAIDPQRGGMVCAEHAPAGPAMECWTCACGCGGLCDTGHSCPMIGNARHGLRLRPGDGWGATIGNHLSLGHDVRECKPEPRIVAECLTCKAAGRPDAFGFVSCRNEAQADNHRKAGHDVREVAR